MPATFDISNFIVDRALRGMMLNSTDRSVMWSVNQITNPSLNITTDKVDAVDALGAKIMTFERAKNAEFSAENSLFDLGLFAAQSGTDKQIATTDNKITNWIFEEIKVSGATGELKYTPKGTVPYIYVLNSDSTLGTRYKVGTTASATDFVLAEGAKEITWPTGLATDTYIYVPYEYEASSAVAVTATGTEFPKAGIFLLEVLGANICDPSSLVHAYIEFPNAKLVSDVDITFSTESTHGFTIQAMPNYCDRVKIASSYERMAA